MKLDAGEIVTADLGRPPCGGRGLKLLLLDEFTALRRSPPVRGAWIETCCLPNYRRSDDVAPRAGGVD